MMKDLSACPICGSTQTSFRFNGFSHRKRDDGMTWPVFSCLDCDHGFMNPQPGPDVLDRYYTADYDPYTERHGADEEDAAIVAEAREKGEFRQIPIPDGKRVLDFGCGGGFFLSICRKLGADVQGIEPSVHGAAVTKGQGIPVFNGHLDAFLAAHGEQRFDVITSSHVIEHVPDPVATLHGLKQLLAPGGTMVIAVPNARSMFANALGPEWYSVDLPFHIHQFSAKSLSKTADLAGLTTNEMGTTSLPSSTGASLRLLWRRKYLVPQKVSVRMPWMDGYARRLAAQQDKRAEGEALLARFG
jgi:2-polyprenyl-3-methyl-5-hydroxy-6-metoxy-1,4-benzoquinol methylase